MEGKNGFVAGLFVVALCALTIGGLNLYENIDVWLHGQKATMELADPDKKIVPYTDASSTRVLDVKYLSDAGEVVVPQKFVPKPIAKRLEAGESIPVTYMTNNHKKVFYQYQRPPNPWIWLIVGIAAMAIAIYALRLRKREVEE